MTRRLHSRFKVTCTPINICHFVCESLVLHILSASKHLQIKQKVIESNSVRLIFAKKISHAIVTFCEIQ